MKFKYRRIFVGSSNAFPNRQFILRPVISVSLIYQKKSLRYETLIDSGSDYTVFPAALGKMLGIKIESGKRESISGISGIPVNVYFHRLMIAVGGAVVKVYAGFADNLNQNFAILGQNGFFSSFKVNFDLKRQEIEVVLRNKG